MSIRSTLLRTTLRSSPSRFYATASTSPLATSRHITNAREAGTNSYVRAGILTVGLLAISGLLFRAGERSSERKHPLAGTPPASTEAIAETEKRINESKNPPELPKSSSDETTIHGKLNSVVENVSSKISNSEILPTKSDSSKEKEFVSKADGSPGNGGEGEEPQAAYNPITGEINWDCPCLGGMADGPCGEEFKLAFSCFVYSEEEPKGVDCVERFRGMQECFRRHPDVYGNEIEEEEEDGDLEERAIAYLAKPDSEFFLPDPVESK